MRSLRRRRWLLLPSAVLAAVPVAFGIIRAVSSGGDVRYLWLAGAAILGSTAVMVSRGASGVPKVSAGRAGGAVAAGAVCAATTAVLMGATAGPGVAIVALAFGLCTGTGAALANFARHPPTR
jgi:hypothetical protein